MYTYQNKRIKFLFCINFEVKNACTLKHRTKDYLHLHNTHRFIVLFCSCNLGNYESCPTVYLVRLSHTKPTFKKRLKLARIFKQRTFHIRVSVLITMNFNKKQHALLSLENVFLVATVCWLINRKTFIKHISKSVFQLSVQINLSILISQCY